MKLRLLAVLLSLGLVRVFSEDNSAQTIFVAPLDGDLSQIQGWQPALGEGLAEMIITELTKLNKFQVIESTALEHLKDEIKLGEEGYVGQDEKVEKGGFVGADFMFRGKVTRFGAKQQGLNLKGFVPGSLGGTQLSRSKSDVRIDWRITDAFNRKVIVSGQAVGEEVGLGFNIGVSVNGHGGGIGFGNQEFMNSALGKATVKALNLIMADVTRVSLPLSGRRQAMDKKAQQGKNEETRKVTELRNTTGKVIAVPSKGIVIVNLGSQQGFKNGEKLKLYETIDTKDDKGEVVFSEEKLVGEVTLESVQNDRSKATYAGSLEVKAGWVVKVQ
jgi:curli biogenesis system outer membrane secretion channel CsgG